MADSIIAQFQREYAAPIETYRQVSTITERDAIPSNRRWEGMLVYVVSENKTYELRGGVDNTFWANSGGLDTTANHFRGTYNPVTDTPALTNINSSLGDEYVIKGATAEGTLTDFGGNSILLKNDDIILHDGTAWFKKVDNNQVSPENLLDFSYLNINTSVSSEETTPEGLAFKPDGTKMFLVGQTNDTIYQYTLSTPWDVSTATYDTVSYGIDLQASVPTGIFFKPDGTRFYVTEAGTTDRVYQFDLLTPWDMSTAEYNAVNFTINTETISSQGLFFKPDGTKMYTTGSASNQVFQYSLSTAWDLSTASYDSISFSVANEQTATSDVFFTSNGSNFFISGTTTDSIYQYSMSTPWDVSTALYDGVVFSVSEQAISPKGIFLKPELDRLYVLDSASDFVYQYSVFKAPIANEIINTFQAQAQESGVFTPTLFDSGAGATYTVSSATGNYYEDIKQVTLEISLENVSTSGTPSGQLRIGNSPFTPTRDFPLILQEAEALNVNFYMLVPILLSTGDIVLRYKNNLDSNLNTNMIATNLTAATKIKIGGTFIKS